MRNNGYKAFEREMRSLEINRIKADFSQLEPMVDSDARAGEQIRIGFQKVVDSLGHCSPKTRRIACRIIKIYQRMHPDDFNRVVAQSLFDSAGKLKESDTELLVAKLHMDLNDFCKARKRGSPEKSEPPADSLN